MKCVYKLLISLYWKFGHKHDHAWRTRLIAHYLPAKILDKDTPGTFVIGQVNKQVELANEPWKFKTDPIIEVTTHETEAWNGSE